MLRGACILTIPMGYSLYIPIAKLTLWNEINKMITNDFHSELDLISSDELTNKIKTAKCSEMTIKLAKLQTHNLKTYNIHLKI